MLNIIFHVLTSYSCISLMKRLFKSVAHSLVNVVFFLFLLFIIEVELTYNVTLVSGVQCNDSTILSVTRAQPY